MPSYNLDDYATNIYTRGIYSKFLADQLRYEKLSNESIKFGNYFYKGINVQGSCVDWKNFILGNVDSPFASLYYDELTAIFSNYNFAEKLYSNYSSFTCSARQSTDPYINGLNQIGINKLVNGLITGESSEYYCDGANWRVYSCTPGYRVLCVNCKEKCVESVYCPGNSFVINSCGAKCRNPAAASALLNLKFASVTLYPDILSMNVTVTKNNTLDIYVKLDKAGYVYCAAFDFYTPMSLYRIKSAGGSALESSNDKVEVLITLGSDKVSPDTTYDVYCYTETFDRNAMDYGAALATKTSVRTMCCRAISFTKAYSSIPIYSTITDYTLKFEFSLNSRPTNSVTIQILLQSYLCAQTTTVSNAEAIPSSFSFEKSSKSLTGTFVVMGNSGCYKLSAIEKNSYYNMTSYNVEISSNPVAPAIEKALFSNDGLKILITFNLPTNKPMRNSTILRSNETSDYFQCGKIMYFNGIGESMCRWESSSMLVSTLDGTSTVISDSIHIFKGIIQSQCIRSSGDCSDYLTSNDMYVVIETAASPVVPVVSLVAPTYVSSCDSLVVNPTATSGQAGRSWKAVSWAVKASSYDTSYNFTSDINQLQKYLVKKANNTDKLVTIPASYLTQGVTYSFYLYVSNFFSQSAYGFFEVYKTASIASPKLSIQGPAYLVKYRWQSLEFLALASVPTCATNLYGRDITLKWMVYSSGALLSFSSISLVETKYFRLAAYTLDSDTLYRIKVVASVTSTINNTVAIYSSAYTDVYIGSSGVHASIRGGSEMSLQISDSSQLDASTSYDIDYPYDSTLLQYEWSCIEYSPSYGDSCSGFNFNQGDVSIISISGLSLGRTYQFSIVVTNKNNLLTSSAFQNVITLENAVPSVIIADVNLKYDPLQKVSLTGVVVADKAAVAAWTLSSTTSSASLNLEDISLTPLLQRISTGTFLFQLAVSANTLSAGYSYSFTLNVYYEDSTSSDASSRAISTITIKMNDPPTGGVIKANPMQGYALNTTFLFITTQWTDDVADYPLKYSFAYYTTSSADKKIVKKEDETNFVYSRLGQGLKILGYTLQVSAFCVDIYSSESNVTIDVTVSPLASTSVLQDAMRITLSTAFTLKDPVLATQIISAVTSSINTVDCTGLPFICKSINRENCENTPKTCGKCLAGYLGLDGDSNIACGEFSGDDSLKKIGESCKYGSNCISGSCSALRCIVAQKTCPGNCNNKGTCIFIDDIGSILESCSTTDSFCRSQCVCKSRYFGNDCSYSSTELVQLKSMRENLCNSLFSASSLQDSSKDVIRNRIKSVSDILVDINQMSELALETCTTVLVNAITDNPEYASDGSIASIAAKALSGVLEKGRNLSPSMLLNVKDAMSSLTQGIQSGLVVGESPVSLITTNVRISTSVVSSSSLLGQTFSSAQSDIEKIQSESPTSLILSYAGDVDPNYDMTIAGISVIEYLKVPESVSNTNSTSIGLETVEYGLSSDRRKLFQTSKFSTVIVLKNREKINYISFVASNISVRCHRKDRVPFLLSQVCPSGFSFDALCPGTLGTFNFSCPGKKTEPECLMWDGSMFSKNPDCEVVDFNSYNTTCSCRGTSRRMLGTTTISGSVLQQFSSAYVVKTANLEKYWFPDDLPLQAETSTVPMTFAASIYIVFIVGIFLFARYDMEERDIVKKKYYEEIFILLNEAYYFISERLHVCTSKLYKGAKFYAAEYGGVYIEAKAKPVIKPKVGPRTAPVTSFRSLSFKNNSSLSKVIPLAEDVNSECESSKMGIQVQSDGDGNNSVLSDSSNNAHSAQIPQITDVIRVADDEMLPNERTIANFFVSLIPPEFQAGNWRVQLWHWIFLEHPWFTLFAPYNLKRDYRFAKYLLATGKYITIIFFSTVMIRYIYPDDGSCEEIKYQNECDSRMTILNVRNACHWIEELEYCYFTDPTYDFLSIVAIVIAVTTLTLPISGIIEYCVPRVSQLVKSYILYTDFKKKKGKELQQLGSKVDGKREFWQTLVVDELKSVQQIGSKIVIAVRLKKIQEYSDFLLPSLEAEMMTTISNDNYRRFQRQDLVTRKGMRHLISNSDTISHSRFKFYAPTKDILINRIIKVREAAENIKRRVHFLEDQNDKEIYMMRHFLVNSFSGYKKRIVKRYAFDPYEVKVTNDDGKYSEQIGFSILLVFVIFLEAYLTLTIGSQIGTRAFLMFVMVVLLSLVEDIFLLQTVRVYLRFIAMTSLVAGEYRKILDGFIRRYKSITWRRLGVMGDSHSLIHHFNPACRVARTLTTLPVSRFMILLNDHDVPLFETPRSFSESKSIRSLLYSVKSAILYTLTILPPLLQDCILDVVGTCSVNLVVILFYLLGVFNIFIGAGAAFLFVTIFATGEYLKYKELKDKEFADSMKVFKMENKRRIKYIMDMTRIIFNIKSKEEREVANMIKQNKKYSRDESTVVFNSKLKPSKAGFQPYDARGVATCTSRGDKTHQIVPLYNINENDETKIDYVNADTINSSASGNTSPVDNFYNSIPSVNTRMKPQGFSFPKSIPNHSNINIPPGNKKIRPPPLSNPMGTAKVKSQALQKPFTIVAPNITINNFYNKDKNATLSTISQVENNTNHTIDDATNEIVQRSIANMERMLSKNIEMMRKKVEKSNKIARRRSAKRIKKLNGGKSLPFYDSNGDSECESNEDRSEFGSSMRSANDSPSRNNTLVNSATLMSPQSIKIKNSKVFLPFRDDEWDDSDPRLKENYTDEVEIRTPISRRGRSARRGRFDKAETPQGPGMSPTKGAFSDNTRSAYDAFNSDSDLNIDLKTLSPAERKERRMLGFELSAEQIKEAKGEIKVIDDGHADFSKSEFPTWHDFR